MIRRIIEAYRREKQHAELDRRIVDMRLGLTQFEIKERERRLRTGNAVIAFFLAIGAAGFLFAVSDPICDTLALMLRALS